MLYVLQCPECDFMFKWNEWPLEGRIILPPHHITCPECNTIFKLNRDKVVINPMSEW